MALGHTGVSYDKHAITLGKRGARLFGRSLTNWRTASAATNPPMLVLHIHIAVFVIDSAEGIPMAAKHNLDISFAILLPLGN